VQTGTVRICVRCPALLRFNLCRCRQEGSTSSTFQRRGTRPVPHAPSIQREKSLRPDVFESVCKHTTDERGVECGNYGTLLRGYRLELLNSRSAKFRK